MKQVVSCFGFATSIAIGCLVTVSSVQAQIVPDNTLPVNSTVTPGCTVCTINGGTVRGANLFHSFSSFGVPTGGEAYFNNGLQIQNILTRVTGNSVSNIDGVLRANGTANLFLLNPNGIIFGAGASLNVGGSFLATTANAIGFGNLGFFSASAPNVPSSLLTVNPSALLFNQLTPAAITSQSIAPSGSDPRGATYGLRVPDGRSLLLVGGDINVDGLGIGDQVNDINGGGLKAYGGRIELGGLAEAGSVGLVVDGNNVSLSFPMGVVRANVSLTNAAEVNVRAGGGGSIAINAQNLTMAGVSQLLAGIDSGLGSSGSIAGNIEINTTGVINLSNLSLLDNTLQEGARGQGGDTNITTSQLLVSGGSQIGAGTFGAGNAGNLTVFASDKVQVIGISADGRIGSGLFTSSLGTGNAGNLTITTGQLLVSNGAQVSAGSFSAGNGGNLTVFATDKVQLIGSSADVRYTSGLLTTSEGTGNAGNITITTGQLLVAAGAQVAAGTFGAGNGGNLTVNATDKVQLIGRSADDLFPTGLYTQSQGTGDAGNLTITTPTLQVQDGAYVSVRSDAGVAGNMTIQANSLLLNQGILSAQTVKNGKDGANINLLGLDLLRLDNESRISANAQNQANGGNITINSTLIVATPPTGPDGSDITGNAAQGNGGRVNITTQGLFGIQFRPQLTPQNDITVSSQSGIPGTFQLDKVAIDPSQGLEVLPTTLVDRTNQIDQSCSAGGGNRENNFTVTGRGGLPQSPTEVISPDMVQDDLGTAVASNAATGESVKPSPTSSPKQLVEAQGWVVDDKGVVTLVAAASTVTPHSPALTPASCQIKGTRE
ncbi:MAG TPA: filamentous hemagglutinin N-terminal domain-containing protein [Waterburya sp.]|jgi:filamentous hemagglutinin family protein